MTDNKHEFETPIELKCVFKGLLVASRRFELFDFDNQTIQGEIGGQLAEEDLQQFNTLTNQRCLASLIKKTVSFVGGKEKRQYELIDLKALS